jgi:undecaprenyl-phosphate 4-deoxy-4-formamido-L-arabinose transferase
VRLWLNMFVNFSVMPLRISTITGFALSLCGLVGGIWVIAEALLLSTPPGWASITAAVLLLSGVQLLILGLIGEYLGRLYLTANRKPQSIVRSVERNDIVEPAQQQPAEPRAPLAARRG